MSSLNLSSMQIWGCLPVCSQAFHTSWDQTFLQTELGVVGSARHHTWLFHLNEKLAPCSHICISHTHGSDVASLKGAAPMISESVQVTILVLGLCAQHEEVSLCFFEGWVLKQHKSLSSLSALSS